jgi:hypothetical protein
MKKWYVIDIKNNNCAEYSAEGAKEAARMFLKNYHSDYKSGDRLIVIPNDEELYHFSHTLPIEVKQTVTYSIK